MRVFALVFCLWGMVTSSAALAADRSFVLASGLRVTLIEVPGTTRAAILLDVAVGAADESSAERGIAHLSEHLYARGKPDGDRFAIRAARLGGEGINAGTDFDRTNFYWTVPVENLAAALAMEASRMRDPREVVVAGALAIEKRIVLAEMREMAWQLDTRVKTVAFPRIFGAGHPHSVLPIGTEQSVGSFDKAMVRAWFGSWYVPGNMRLIVAGPFVVQDVELMIRRQFAAPVSPLPERDLSHIGPNGAVSAGVVTIEADTAAVTFYGAAPPLSHPQGAALDRAVAIAQSTFAEAVRAQYGSAATGSLWYRASERAGNIGARIAFPGDVPVAGAAIFIIDWLSSADLCNAQEVTWRPMPRPPADTPLGAAFASLLGDDERREEIAATSIEDARTAFAAWFNRPLQVIETRRRVVPTEPILSVYIGCLAITARQAANPDLLLITIEQAAETRDRPKGCAPSFARTFADDLTEMVREKHGWAYSVREEAISFKAPARSSSFLIPAAQAGEVIERLEGLAATR